MTGLSSTGMIIPSACGRWPRALWGRTVVSRHCARSIGDPKVRERSSRSFPREPASRREKTSPFGIATLDRAFTSRGAAQPGGPTSGRRSTEQHPHEPRVGSCRGLNRTPLTPGPCGGAHALIDLSKLALRSDGVWSETGERSAAGKAASSSSR